jgi:hypothetical protein
LINANPQLLYKIFLDWVQKIYWMMRLLINWFWQ